MIYLRVILNSTRLILCIPIYMRVHLYILRSSLSSEGVMRISSGCHSHDGVGDKDSSPEVPVRRAEHGNAISHTMSSDLQMKDFFP